MKPLNITWRGRAYAISATKYVENGNTCLVLLGPNDTVEAKPTVNIAPLPPHLVFIKDWSENKGIAELLVKREFIRPTGKTIRIGAMEVKQYELAQDFGQALGILVPATESEVLEVDVNADQTTLDPSPQPPALESVDPAAVAAVESEGLNVPELVEGLEAVGLHPIVIDENTNFDDLPDLQQEKLEEDARDIAMEQEESRAIEEAEADAAVETNNATEEGAGSPDAPK